MLNPNASPMRRHALLILVCLAAFLPGIAALPPIDRDEPRFAQASRQMVESGDPIDIRFQGETRYKKPAGIYWLQAGAAKLSGLGADAPIWVYRLVSVFAGIVAVCATFATGRRLFGKDAGFIAALALAGIFGLAFEARIAKTDATLLATAVLAQGALARIYLAARRDEASPRSAFWLFWIAEGVSILIKGPILPALSALTAATLAILDRDRRWLRSLKPLRGLAVIVLIAAPWIAAISAKAGWAFWHESVGNDMLGKVAGGQESHGFPPGYYVLSYSLMLWPFGALALDGGFAMLRRFSADPRLKFLFAWYVPWWIVCEVLPTKLPHYMLPAYPALLLLMAWWLSTAKDEAGTPRPRWHTWMAMLARLGVVVVTLGLAALAVGLPVYFRMFPVWGIPAAIAFLIAGWFGIGLSGSVPPLRRTGAMTVCSLVAIGLLAAKVLPAVDFIWPSRAIAEAFRTAASCPDSRLVAAGYAEPSLVFLTSADTLLTDGANAAGRLIERPCDIAAVTSEYDTAFRQTLASVGRKAEPAGKVEAFNYSNGKPVSITLYRLAQ